MVKKHDVLEVEVDSVKFPNIGIVSDFDRKMRIKGALKGEKLQVRVSKKRKNHYEAKVIEKIEKSPMEKIDPCPHFGRCGGCSYQSLTYEDELKYKIDQVEDLFEKNNIEIDNLEIQPSPLVEGYRNKMEYTFGDEYKDGPLSLGMHMKGKYYEIETVDQCKIADEDFNTILSSVLEYFKTTDLSFYHRRMHKGNLRNLSVRKALSTGEIMINLVTTSQDEIDIDRFKDMLLDLKLKGNIVGILHTINDGVADVIKADKLELIYGRDYIVEEICDLKFKISPFSFFQTNTYSAEKLYELVREIIGDVRDKTIFDLYSGTGTIAQILSKNAKEVIAVEIVEEAVDMARENAEINDLDNITFYTGDVKKVVEDLNVSPDIIVIDPPRPGLEKAVEKVIEFNPDSFIYISCNPVTLVKDLKAFLDNDYEINQIKLVDQFPRTPHVEAVLRLDKKTTSLD